MSPTVSDDMRSGDSSGSVRVPRYAPWLQKALRIKQQSERFWTTQTQKHQELPWVPLCKLANTSNAEPAPQCPTVWHAIAAHDVGYVRAYLETDVQRVFVRRDSVPDGGGGATLLHEAATHGARAIVALLLDVLAAHYSPETTRNTLVSVDTYCSQTTALIAACRSSAGSMQERLALVRLLVAAESDVAQQDAHGDNAIHWCARESHTSLLRFFLHETDAGVAAVFATNSKRETPLDIAKRRLTQEPSMLTTTTFILLRYVDRKCNMHLMLQLVKRAENQQHVDARARATQELHAALERASVAADHADQTWTSTLQQAEATRCAAENAHVAATVDAASAAALNWLDAKDGKNFVKKQLASATQQLKLEVQSGRVAKPKDMKKAAAQRVQGDYCNEQIALARRHAVDVFRATTPAYARESRTPPAALRSALGLSTS